MNISSRKFNRYICNHLGFVCFGTVVVAIVFSCYFCLGQQHSFSRISEKLYEGDLLSYEIGKVQSQKKKDSRNGEPVVSMTQPPNRIDDESLFSNPKKIDVVITFTNAKSNYLLQEKFRVSVTSMLSLTSTPIAFYILGDVDSQNIAENILNEYPEYAHYTIVGLDIDNITHELYDIVKDLQKHFSVEQSYYNDALFYMSIAIHRVMPSNLQQIIMLDADLKFNADIKDLYHLFSDFSETNIIGIAREAQPVYRHQFSLYRSRNKGTRVGGPPPDGLTGFNSGVLLLDLQKMRQSSEYNSHISVEVVEHLRKKYSFSGHLGDQCFFTLLSLEHEELFYVIPCTWNRQLCVWWRGKGYDDIFDQYFRCDGHINIYHGNCNTRIPDTD